MNKDEKEKDAGGAEASETKEETKMMGYGGGGKQAKKSAPESKDKMMEEMKYTPAASFAELAAMENAEKIEEMADYFPQMVSNIICRAEIEDKGEAIRSLAVEFIGVVNEKLSEDKAANKEAAEDTSEPKKQVDEDSLFNRLLDKAKAALGIEEKEQKQSDVYIWKDTDSGKYKCVLAYSNNFRDNDNPPEIITAESHKDFDEALNKGEWPMPELWLWHTPYPVGHVDFHTYDEKSGFSVAAATFDKAWAAEALMESGEWDALSHGMPKAEIVRDKEDDSLIVRHRTKEISFLPKWAAANKLTFHYISKESNMENQVKGLGDKRPDFVSLIGEEKTAELEGSLAGKSDKAREDGVEQKEEAKAEAADEKQAPEEKPLTRKELFEALKFVTDEIKAIKEEMHQEAEQKQEEEPQDLVAMLKQHSAIGKEEARVDGRTKEAKDGPEEADYNSKSESVTGVPLLDKMIANKQAYAVKHNLNLGNLPPEALANMTEANQ